MLRRMTRGRLCFASRFLGAWAALCALPLLACGGDDGGGGNADGGPGGADGSALVGGSGGGAAGGGMTLGACQVPAGATVVLQPTVLSESPLYRMAVDGDRLYFTSVDELHSVATAGGAATLLYPPAGATNDLITPPFFVRATDILLLRNRNVLFLPKTGGAATAMKQLPGGYAKALDGRADIFLDPDGVTLNYKSDVFEPPGASFHRFNLQTDAATQLVQSAPFGSTRTIAQAGGYLYTASNPGEIGSEVPSTLHRVPLAGGAAEQVPLMGGALRFNVAGASATHVYLAGAPVPLDVTADPGGLYRVPLAGGAVTRVVRDLAVFNLNSGVVPLAGHDILYLSGKFYKLPAGASEPTLLFSVNATATCTDHAFTADAGFVYGSLFDSAAKRVIVYKVAVP